MYKYFSKNGEILPIEQAVVPITNLEYSYGYGVYETLRVEKKYCFFLTDHVERLLKSAQIIELNHNFNLDKISKYIHELINSLEEDTFNLKILLIGGKTTDDVLLYIYPTTPFFPDKRLYKEGVTVITYKYERLLPNAKTLNMLPSYLAYSRAKSLDCYDALFVNNQGYITEGTRTNFFVIKEKTLFTPPAKDVLEGVTRKVIINLANENGYQVIEQEIPLDSLSKYDGAFLTSTSSKILPIKKIDDFEYKEIVLGTQELMNQFNNYLDSYIVS